MITPNPFILRAELQLTMVLTFFHCQSRITPPLSLSGQNYNPPVIVSVELYLTLLGPGIITPSPVIVRVELHQTFSLSGNNYKSPCYFQGRIKPNIVIVKAELHLTLSLSGHNYTYGRVLKKNS